jgi:hypothetical protein
VARRLDTLQIQKREPPTLRLALVFALATMIFASAPFLAPMKLDASAAIPIYHHH